MRKDLDTLIYDAAVIDVFLNVQAGQSAFTQPGLRAIMLHSISKSKKYDRENKHSSHRTFMA